MVPAPAGRGRETVGVRFLLSEVAAACRGRVVDGEAAVEVSGASIDSRSIRAGQLFVPVVAERDGHDFAVLAHQAGAVAHLCSRAEPVPGAGPGVLVADTARALADLGRVARHRIAGAVIGVTGSVGKTSVKDLTAAALRAAGPVAASERSFNNELGVPLTLVNAPDDAIAAVVEMGARGEGHIALLADIAHPTIGVITRVAPAHLELFGSIEGVARAKGELIESLPADGVAVLNADDALVLAMAGRGRARVLTYGRDGDLRAEQMVLDTAARASFVAATPWGRAPVRLPMPGQHMVANALAALGAALAAGAGLDDASAGLATAQLSPWRMELGTAPSGAMVLNDAYNASPVAVQAAFETLLSLRGSGRCVAVLGQMAELGEVGDAAHRELAELAAERGIELFAVGTDRYGVAVERSWATVEDAVQGVAALGLGAGDAVLVKASRVVGLERLAARLLATGGAAPAEPDDGPGQRDVGGVGPGVIGATAAGA